MLTIASQFRTNLVCSIYIHDHVLGEPWTTQQTRLVVSMTFFVYGEIDEYTFSGVCWCVEILSRHGTCSFGRYLVQVEVLFNVS